ncbi:hypothetical protein [Ferruginibacter sp.]
MKLLFPAIGIVLFTACNNNDTKTTPVVNTVHATEEAAIKKAVADAYTCISFKQGEQPKFDAVKNYFVPQAQFFNFRNDTLEYFTIDQFAAAYKEFITSNKIGSFYEEEISGTTEQFGRIAQRISTYKTYVNTMDSVAERGVNSFQLVKTAQGWKVTSIIWDVESAKLPIPAYYLKPDSAK